MNRFHRLKIIHPPRFDRVVLVEIQQEPENPRRKSTQIEKISESSGIKDLIIFYKKKITSLICNGRIYKYVENTN
jgi:hypothetical protein